MKLPIKLGGKWITVALVIIAATVSSITTAKLTSISKERQFEKREKIYIEQINKMFDLNAELAKIPKNMISNTWTFKKNKNGTMIFEPSSNMDVTESLKEIDKKVNDVSTVVDSTDVKNTKSIWQKLKFWEK
jgi:hypothetical protein